MIELKEILREILKDLGEIKNLQGIQAQQLAEHMRRTDALESRVEQVDKDLRPVKTKLEAFKIFFQFLGVVAAILSIIKAVITWSR